MSRDGTRDEALLLDVLTFARDACDFVAGMGWSAFKDSKLHQYAVIRAVEVVGEAASKITPAFKDAQPKVPWAEMVGMRNRLAHDYGGVRLDVVWDVVTHHLPGLIEAIEPLVPPPPPLGDLGGGSPQSPSEKAKPQDGSRSSPSNSLGRSRGRGAGKGGWER